MAARVTPKQKDTLYRLLREGLTLKQAANAAGVSYSWAKLHISKMPEKGAALKEAQTAANLGGPVPFDKLNPRAKRGLEDFEFFRRTYLGHITPPWQREDAEITVQLLASPDKEYVVKNMPPGSGKTTLLHDIACWVTTRDRSIRGLMGSATSPKATTMLRRLRRSFERTSPVRASAEDKERGIACDAVTTLAHDYGLFKPPSGGDLWRSEAFVVLQHGDVLIDEKEPTWSAFGMDQDFLGGRYDIVFWDDLVTMKHVRTMESVEQQREWFDREAESRLEPGGAFFLVGQRIATNDLYRHCLDKKALPEDDDTVEALINLEADDRANALADQPGVYRHIVYKAHDETRCDNEHGRDAPAWPDGCLLDPHRLTWRELRAIRANNPQKYATWYQQEDADPKAAFVKSVWISGGTDPDEGTYHPGCWDNARDLCELPAGIIGPRYSFATVDPSPSKMWAVQWWVYCPAASHSLFLMDTLRISAAANELLDWNNNSQSFYGVMEEWQQRSIDKDLKIKDWIFENNAAQRWFYQFEHCNRWQQHHMISVRPHTTTLRKNDADLGVDMIRDWWRHGRIRLPGKQGGQARTHSLKLVEEVTRYGAPISDDQVMACYFAVLWLPTLSSGWDVTEVPKFKTPTWLQGVYGPQGLQGAVA